MGPDLKSKKPERKKLDFIHSLFTDIDLTLANIKDTLNSHILMKEYWLKRINAIAIDYFILLIATGIIWPTAHFTEVFLTMGILSILYFAITESYLGYTIGKKIFALKVVNLNGTKPSLKTAFARNISKFNAVFLILDTIVGRFTSSPHQKFLDKIANTTVDDLAATITA